MICACVTCVQGEKVVCPVDASGKFTQEVTDYQGVYVKVLTLSHPHTMLTQHYYCRKQTRPLHVI